MTVESETTMSHVHSKSKFTVRRVLGSRRLIIYFALLIIVVGILTIIRLVTKMRESFENFHFASDTDFELVTLPKSFAFQRGARCLDGSPPAYYFRPGTVTSESWIIHLLPGAWCETDENCYQRSLSGLGSSKKASTTITFNGLFSKDCKYNPQYCSWNVAIILYCDGSSFLGNVTKPIEYRSTQLYSRGALIFDAVLEYLVLKTDLNKAEQVILTGASAGGTAALIHADRLRTKLPPSVHSLHVVLDGSMFVDVPDINGTQTLAQLFHSIYDYHNIKDAESIQECTKTLPAKDAWKCLFVSTYSSFVFTPVFFINSVFDTWQRYHGLLIICDHNSCPEKHLDTVHKARDATRDLAKAVTQTKKNAVFLTYCPMHTMIEKLTFFDSLVGNVAMNESLALWLLHSESQQLSETPLSLEEGMKTCVS